MKAIICDTCGKSVPDTKDADIMPLSLTYGKENIKYIERDICPDCVESLVLFFEPRPLDKLVNEIVAEQNRQYKSEPELKPMSQEDFIKLFGNPLTEAAKAADINSGAIIKEETQMIHDAILDGINSNLANKVAEANSTTFEVEHANIDGHHLKFQPAEDIREIKQAEVVAIECVHCHKLFVPKTANAKCCSKYCSNHHWIDKQKLKNETPEQKKIRTDALLKKLKDENPVKRNDERPKSIYREM
jgi:hypothetical protein